MSYSEIDFLQPGLSQIKQSIQGIIDSYNNPWDILAELIQNSVDAIREKENSEAGKIILNVDCSNNCISIFDNGIGIDPKNLPELMKPFSTNKNESAKTIGEKGVGLKYAIFSSNIFKIKSGNDNGVSSGEIVGARSWRDSSESTELILKYEKLDDDDFRGTFVSLEGVDNGYIFKLSLKQLVFTLRTCTALGNTNSIWQTDIDIDITLNYTDIDGDEIKGTKVPFKYFLLTEKIADQSIDLDDFIDWDQAESRTDVERRRKLNNKAIYCKGVFIPDNTRKLSYFALFVPKRRIWDDSTVNFSLATEEQIHDENWISSYYFSKLNSGIFLSTKGMPTGITIEHPSTGFSGYWDNIFILFNDNLLKFDIGRKTIHGRRVSIHKKYSKTIFNKFIKYVPKYVSGDIHIDSPSEWVKDEIFEEISEMININKTWLKFQKVPQDQEASVAAIFFECIGNGKIQDITPLISGYKNKYDLYAKWGRRKVVIEFKARLQNITRDFKDLQKLFDEINCIVCWEVTSSDIQKMSNMQIAVDTIQSQNLLSGKNQIFPHATHTMNLSGLTNPIYIIDLKVLLDSVPN